MQNTTDLATTDMLRNAVVLLRDALEGVLEHGNETVTNGIGMELPSEENEKATTHAHAVLEHTKVLAELISTPIDADSVLTCIVSLGLSVRQIPEKVVSRWSAHNRKDGDTIVVVNGREYIEEVRIPEHAGYWMCQRVLDTSSRVEWDKKRHCLAPTLKESVALFMRSL